MSGFEDMTVDEAGDCDLAAAAWFHRLAAAKGANAAETRRQFQEWLDSSADNAEAFARTAAAWNEIGEHAAAPEMMALRQAAIADSRNAGLARWRDADREPSRWPWAIAASLVPALALGAGAYFYFSPAPAQTIATEIGQREAVTLSDNSRIDIDADSAVSIDFTPDRRLVHVARGQAYFKVAKDPARPFIVESAGRAVIATGTEFDVEKLDDGMRVTLVEGHVVVRPVSGGGATAELSPNDQFTEESNAPPRLLHLANTLAETAWREGKLLFDNEPLKAAIARMMRYSHVAVSSDPALSGLRISGAFDAGDMPAFVDALKAYYPVDAVSDGPNALRLVRRR